MVFCFCQGCAGLSILDVDVMFRISSDVYKTVGLWILSYCFEQVRKESTNLFHEIDSILLFFLLFLLFPLLYRTLL